MLVTVKIVAALEAGGAGELGLLDAIVERDALVADDVAAGDARAVKPPFVAAEQQMRARDAADAGRRRAMAVVHRDREGLRRDELPVGTLGGEILVVMKPVGIVHRLHPAADVGVAERIVHRRWADGLAEILVDVGTVERGVGHDNSPYWLISPLAGPAIRDSGTDWVEG